MQIKNPEKCFLESLAKTERWIVEPNLRRIIVFMIVCSFKSEGK
jgi:hypothetical protein